jgi:hypothetical protein
LSLDGKLTWKVLGEVEGSRKRFYEVARVTIFVANFSFENRL